MSRSLASAFVLGLLLLAGCLKRDIERKRVELRDQGDLCLGAQVGGDAGAIMPVDLQAGQPLAIVVRSSQCLSDFCATERSASCSLKREGDRIIVKTEMSWNGPIDLGDRCPPQCSYIETHCVTEALPAGKYQIVLGTRALPIDLPSHLPRSCVDAPSPVPTFTPPPRDAAPPPAKVATVALDPSAMPAGPATGVAPEPPPPGDTMCIGPAIASKTRALKAGQPVAITVLHKNACQGSSCSLAPGKCTAKRKGPAIVVTTQFPTSKTKPTKPCTEDCSAIAATCKTDALPTGVYTITLDAQKKTLQIPAPTSPPCAN